MCRHESKQCPRCTAEFECKTNNVLQCQCAGIPLIETQREAIAAEYDDCLCAKCLNEIASGIALMQQWIAARS